MAEKGVGKRTLAASICESRQRRSGLYFPPPLLRLENDAMLGVRNGVGGNVKLYGKVVAVFALPCRQRPRPIINCQRELGRLPSAARNHKLRRAFARAY
jgi:hypothetical protein